MSLRIMRRMNILMVKNVYGIGEGDDLKRHRSIITNEGGRRVREGPS